MKCLLPPQPVAVVATNDLTLRFIDFRAQTLQHTWKLHFTTGGEANWAALTHMYVLSKYVETDFIAKTSDSRFAQTIRGFTKRIYEGHDLQE
jgi:hypothetical protein